MGISVLKGEGDLGLNPLAKNCTCLLTPGGGTDQRFRLSSNDIDHVFSMSNASSCYAAICAYSVVQPLIVGMLAASTKLRSKYVLRPYFCTWTFAEWKLRT